MNDRRRACCALLVVSCFAVPPLALNAQPAPSASGRVELPREATSWTGEIPAGKTLEVKSIVGPIRFEPAAGTTASVEFGRRVPPGVPDTPVMTVVTHENGVTICPVYPSTNPAKPNDCVPGRGRGRMKSELWEKGVTFDYVVRVPPGVRFAAETATGEISGRLVASDADLKTFKGAIRVETAAGLKADALAPVTVRLAPGEADRVIELKTGNADATVLIPPRMRYSYTLDVLNGRIRAADGPKVEVNGMSKSAYGSGGRSGPKTKVRIDTINGDAVVQPTPD